jgi:hypothetical protein
MSPVDVTWSVDACLYRHHVGSDLCGGPVTCRGGLVIVSGGDVYHGLGGHRGGLHGGRRACLCLGHGRDRRDLGHQYIDLRNDLANGHGVRATSSGRGGVGSIVHGRGRTLNYQRGAPPCRLVVRYYLVSVQ